MDKYLSVKLRVISFFLIVLVIFLHSYNLPLEKHTGNTILREGYSSYVQYFCTQGITRVAVPLFFAISGYLFFLNITGKPDEFLIKMKKRIKTIAVPYLLWSLIGLLFNYILQQFPFSRRFFTHKLFADYSAGELLHTVLIDPVPYQLWFLRDLIVLVVLSPVLFLLVRYLKSFLLLFLLIIWGTRLDLIIFSNEALLFFTFGAFLAIQHVEIGYGKLVKSSGLLFALWIVLIICKMLLISIMMKQPVILNLLHKASVLVGVAAVWGIYDKLFGNKEISGTRFYYISGFSFFLYAFHEPMLMMVKKACFVITGKGEAATLLIYFLVPLIIIASGTTMAWVLKNKVPGLYRVATGGR